MAKYFLTPKAVEDLSQIWTYTSEVWSEQQADKYYELLTASFEDLSKNPKPGKGYPEIHPELMGRRVGKHIIFYQVVASGNIEIIRILHQSMDLSRRLEE